MPTLDDRPHPPAASSNGHVDAGVHPADGRPVAAESLLRLAEADRRAAAEFLASSYRDELTGALQRKPGREQLAAAVARARRTSAPLSVVFLDVDGLKEVNDEAGHEAGDRLLAAAGAALRAALREDDIVVRYGGDEFVCALMDLAEADVPATLDRVHATLRTLEPRAHLSAGWSQLAASDTLGDVLSRADAHLYRLRRLVRGPAGRRRGPDRRACSTIACGACAARIDVTDFVLVARHRATRLADCPECGEPTLIQLAHEGASALEQ